MSITVKLEKSEINREERPVTKKIKAGSNRKITLTRPGETRLSSEDNTDVATAMAATLCHEINNPLMTITAVAEVLLSGHKELAPDVIEKIETIATEAERIRKATHKLIGLDSLQYCETAASKMILIDDSSRKPENSDKKQPVKSSQ